MGVGVTLERRRTHEACSCLYTRTCELWHSDNINRDQIVAFAFPSSSTLRIHTSLPSGSPRLFVVDLGVHTYGEVRGRDIDGPHIMYNKHIDLVRRATLGSLQLQAWPPHQLQIAAIRTVPLLHMQAGRNPHEYDHKQRSRGREDILALDTQPKYYLP